MTKRALLLSGFLNENDIKLVQEFVTGNKMEFETLKSLIGNKKKVSSHLSYIPGTPKIDFIEKKYASICNDYYKEYKNNSFSTQVEWSFKSVEICPLLCSSVFLDLDKINYFQSIFKDTSYENVLNVCLSLQKTEIQFKHENNSITVSSNNPNIIGLVLAPDLKVLPQANPSPIKVARINDRYILIDGKHRAVALHKVGYEKIPAIVFNGDSPYKVQPRYLFNRNILLSEAPPTIGHYMNEDFVSEVPLINTLNIFRILTDKTVIQI